MILLDKILSCGQTNTVKNSPPPNGGGQGGEEGFIQGICISTK